MITFNRVLKHQLPYRPKWYRGVVKVDGELRELHRQFRTHARAYKYGNLVVARYEQLVRASVMDQIQAGGNTGESAAVV